jgi:hypothetical protein
LANERIIERISFIDCVNMGSRIMILVKIWYKLINLIKIFEWERVYIYILLYIWKEMMWYTCQSRRGCQANTTAGNFSSSLIVR